MSQKRELEKAIQYLQEELLRKDKEIQKLKEENILLFKSSLRQANKNQEIVETIEQFKKQKIK